MAAGFYVTQSYSGREGVTCTTAENAKNVRETSGDLQSLVSGLENRSLLLPT